MVNVEKGGVNGEWEALSRDWGSQRIRESGALGL